MEICYISRAIRLILLYKLNVFKVTQLKEDKYNKLLRRGTTIEPNIYYKSIYKIVDKRIVRFLLIFLVIIDFLVCVYFHIKSESCSFNQFVNINEKISQSKQINNIENINKNNTNIDNSNVDKKDINY